MTGVTEDYYIPSNEELTCEEIPLSAAPLRAAAFHVGKYCENENNEFLLCRDELKDPRQCITEGKAVTACAMNFFRQLKKTCYNEFNTYAHCLEKSSGNFDYKHCRETQKVYDKCVFDNMGLKRPYYGYFTRVRVHDSPRPPPPPKKKILYEDVPDSLPDSAPRNPAKYGSRQEYLNE